MFSFFAIKFIDSDWAFDNFKFSNHNLVVIFITFGLIFVNVFTIYQELRFSPLLSRVSAADKESYIIYENGLYILSSSCSSFRQVFIALTESPVSYIVNVDG